MRIGIDGNEANVGKRVGVNMYAINLLHALKSLASPHLFTIYLKNPPLSDLPAKSDNWQYRVIPFPKLWTQTRLPIDLWFHSPRPDIFFSLNHYAPRFSPVPTVIAVMDLGFLAYPDQFTVKDLNQLTSWTAYSVKNAKKIIAISEFTKSDIQKYYHVPADDITVTYLGYDKHVFYPQTDLKVLDKYHITKPYILFLSALKPSKNVEGLVQAFARLDLSDYQLVIAGKKAWMYEQIFNLVTSLHLERQVVFTDYVAQTEVPVLMSMAKVFVLPSFHEGFALPAIEAMACGTPVVVSNVANLPEVAGEAVVYVDPYDVSSIAEGIKRAIGKDHARLIQEGLKQAKYFDWQTTAKQTLAVLESAI
jgi:glycosyltransferase involved in cell wall biosynthesis